MADLSKTVEIIFSAKDDVSQGLSSVTSSVQGFTSSLGQVTQPLSNLASGIELIETAVAGVALAFGAASLNAFKGFQDASIDLAKVLEDTDPSIKEFEQSAKDLSLTYGISAETILQGTSNFKQAGFTAQEAALLQKNALDLIIAGDVDAAKASEILVKSLKGFNISAAESTQYVESLNAVSNKYATDVSQLAEGMSRISPIADTMGFSFQETAGLLTPVIEVFGSGEQAADGLKTGLLKLIDDSKPVRAALESIGVSQKDANGELKSGKDIFYEVAAAFVNMDDKQKLFITSQLVGLDQAPKMVKVFDNLAKVQEITAVAMENTGSVAQEVEKRLNSLSVVTKINEQAWHLLSIEVGEQLAGGAVDSTKAMTALGSALTTAVKSGQFSPIVDGINAAETGFANFVNQVAKDLPEALKLVKFDGLIAAFKNLGIEFGDIFGGVDLGTPQGLAKAIQFVVDSITSLQIVIAGIVDGWTPFIQGGLKAIETFNGLDESTKKFIGQGLGIAQALNNVLGVLNSSTGALKGFGGILSDLANTKAAANLAELVLTIGRINPVAALATTAVAGVGFAAVKGAEAWEQYDNAQKTIEESSNNLADNQGKIAIRLAEISERTGIVVNSMDDLNKAVDDGVLVFDKATGQYIKAGTEVRNFDAEVDAAAKGGFDFASSVLKVSDALGLEQDELGKVVGEFATLEEAHAAVLEQNSDLVQSNIRYEDGVYKLYTKEKTLAETHQDVAEKTKKLEEETGKLTERQKLAIEHTNELEIKLLELASNERIKSMEFAVSLKVAEMETDAQRVVAAFEEIGQAVAATQAASAEIFASLTGALGDEKIRGLDRNFLKDYAMEQQKQAQQALDDQSRLIDAQIYWMNAKTEALNSGKPMITVNADDLAPELQLVLRSLLEHLQLEANSEGLELLLG